MNQLSSFESKKKILAGWIASRISDDLTNDLVGFSSGSVNPFYNVDQFHQEEVNFSLVVVNCASEKCVDKERVFATSYNDGSAKEENDEEIKGS